MKLLFLLIPLFFAPYGQKYAPENIMSSMDEMELYAIVEDYRKTKRLPKIPMSKALTYVAQTHAADLEQHFDPERNKRCNMHSWSDHGDWLPVCYTDNHAKAALMWSKPGELTDYEGSGYEIVAWYSEKITPELALEMWLDSPSHRALLDNKGDWREQWQAIGIGMSEHYAVIWFGNYTDLNIFVGD